MTRLRLSGSGSVSAFIPSCLRLPLFSPGELSIEDLFSETLLLRESGSGTREILTQYLEHYNYDIRRFSKVLEITNMHTIRVLTEENCGITFLYEAVAEEGLRRGSLIRIPLKDFDITHNILSSGGATVSLPENTRNSSGNFPDSSQWQP